MATFEQIKNPDFFFYYGEGVLSLEDEAQHDIYEQVMQPARSYFYNRREAIGLPEYENNPISALDDIFIRFLIADGIAYKNKIVTSGSIGQVDRRVAVSQNSVNVRSKPNGALDIGVQFFRYANYEKPDNITIPIGGV